MRRWGEGEAREARGDGQIREQGPDVWRLIVFGSNTPGPSLMVIRKGTWSLQVGPNTVAVGGGAWCI
jgi:hypothetical protein